MASLRLNLMLLIFLVRIHRLNWHRYWVSNHNHRLSYLWLQVRLHRWVTWLWRVVTTILMDQSSIRKATSTELPRLVLSHVDVDIHRLVGTRRPHLVLTVEVKVKNRWVNLTNVVIIYCTCIGHTRGCRGFLRSDIYNVRTSERLLVIWPGFVPWSASLAQLNWTLSIYLGALHRVRAIWRGLLLDLKIEPSCRSSAVVTVMILVVLWRHDSIIRFSPLLYHILVLTLLVTYIVRIALVLLEVDVLELHSQREVAPSLPFLELLVSVIHKLEMHLLPLHWKLFLNRLGQRLLLINRSFFNQVIGPRLLEDILVDLTFNKFWALWQLTSHFVLVGGYKLISRVLLPWIQTPAIQFSPASIRTGEAPSLWMPFFPLILETVLNILFKVGSWP